jgi:hypothetical protein
MAHLIERKTYKTAAIGTGVSDHVIWDPGLGSRVFVHELIITVRGATSGQIRLYTGDKNDPNNILVDETFDPGATVGDIRRHEQYRFPFMGTAEDVLKVDNPTGIDVSIQVIGYLVPA